MLAKPISLSFTKNTYFLMKHRQNVQTVSWFWDLYQRDLLDLNPEYQRRSVWNQEYKDNFIDTILLGYPSPAIFLFEEIDPNGMTRYNVIDGKQRLLTVFEFVEERFPVSDHTSIKKLRGKYFNGIDKDVRVSFWNYQLSVVYVNTTEEDILNDIFDRINRNVSKLTSQELRHARLSGDFIKSAEDLTEWSASQLPANFPRFQTKSRRQMKDVEFTSHLLLYLENGIKSYSQDDLDKAFTDRDISWERKHEIETRFREVIRVLKEIANNPNISKSRLRNQADFYSLFGAIALLEDKDKLPPSKVVIDRLQNFMSFVEDEELRSKNDMAKRYYEAARAASNDAGPRKDRIDIIKSVICGDQVE